MGNDVSQSDAAAKWASGSLRSSLSSFPADAINRSEERSVDSEPRTGIAPPFRALLGTSAPSVSMDPDELRESAHPARCDRLAVPGYEIVAELGRGGMGVVYRARQCSLNRPVALKMILSSLQTDSRACLRFRTEAEAVARLRHAHIVQIHEVGEYDGRPFLSLEYIEGGSLLQKVAGRAQPETEAARLLETLARAVHYMHLRGILHRDLKPNNVLLTADGTPKITDFGLAKILDSDLAATKTETMIGTPSYMAPEQAAGNSQQVGASADIYSLGAILYELLTGRAPFQGATPLSTLEQVRTQEPVAPRRLRRSVSLDLETICLKCLQKEPAKRYSSAEALADDLHRFLEGQPIRARAVPVWQQLWSSARRRPTLVARVLIAVALLCVPLTCAWYFRMAHHLALHRAEEKYQQFVQRRNDALLYGLLTPDQGAIFLGADAAANLQMAESAARKALDLAGLNGKYEATSLASGLPASRQTEVVTDCYSLLLVLASVRGQSEESDFQSSDLRRLTAEQGDKGRYQEALRILDLAPHLGFQTQAYHLRRVHFLEQLGEHEEARRERDLAASLRPNGALDHFLVGEEQYRRGDWQLAINSFNRALSLEPGHFWAEFFLAVCQLKVQGWEAAKAGLNACLTQQPEFVWAYLFRSFANEKLRELPEAEADFQKAIELNPNGDARYVLFLTRGIHHFNQGELEHAAADFQTALNLKPQQYNAYLNMAHVRLAEKRFEEAEEQVRMALRLRPPSQVVFGYHLERGHRLLRDEKYEEAIRASLDALALCPDQPLPHEVCGRASLALGRYDQAEKSFDQYLSRGGQEHSDIFRGRGLARMKLGKFPEATEDYSLALERAPDADIYQHRGWAHFFSDAWKLALRDFSKAIELDPEASDAYTGRGLARVMLGNYREAITDAEAALFREPATPEMMHNIACIFAQAIPCAEADSQEANRQSLADVYRSRALESVRKTLAMLPPEDRSSFWKNTILPDAALTPIRKDAEFVRLQNQYYQVN